MSCELRAATLTDRQSVNLTHSPTSREKRWFSQAFVFRHATTFLSWICPPSILHTYIAAPGQLYLSFPHHKLPSTPTPIGKARGSLFYPTSSPAGTNPLQLTICCSLRCPIALPSIARVTHHLGPAAAICCFVGGKEGPIFIVCFSLSCFFCYM